MEELVYPFDGRPEPGAAIDIAPGIKWIRMPLPFALNHINLWLLEDDGGWVIVDTGLRWKKIRQLWEKVLAGVMGGRPVNRVIVTHYHPDHMGLAGSLCDRLKAPLWMSRADYLMGQAMLLGREQGPSDQAVDFYRRCGFGEKALEAFAREGYSSFARAVEMPPPSFRAIADGEELSIGGRIWRVLIRGGHAPEHACLYCPAENILISGDQVLPRISSNVSVYPMEPDANPLEDWFRALELLLELPAEALVLPSHNEPFRGLHVRLRQLQKHHRDRLQAVTESCTGGPKTVLELYAVLFGRRISGFEHMFAAGEALAHLHYLIEDGVLRRQPGADGIDRFAAAGGRG